MRNSSHPVARALVTGAGVPLTATSANISGESSCSSAQEVEAQLGDLVDLIIDSGPTQGLLPSTILDLTVSPPAIIREGVISRDRLTPHLAPPF